MGARFAAEVQKANDLIVLGPHRGVAHAEMIDAAPIWYAARRRLRSVWDRDLVAVLLSDECSSVSQSPADASSMDVHDAASDDSVDASPADRPLDGSALCTYPAGGAPVDGGAFKAVCPIRRVPFWNGLCL